MSSLKILKLSFHLVAATSVVCAWSIGSSEAQLHFACAKLSDESAANIFGARPVVVLGKLRERKDYALADAETGKWSIATKNGVVVSTSQLEISKIYKLDKEIDDDHTYEIGDIVPIIETSYCFRCNFIDAPKSFLPLEYESIFLMSFTKKY